MKYKSPYKSRNDVFNIYCLENEILNKTSNSISFDTTIKVSKSESKVFLGLINSSKIDGLAVSIDVGTGEVEDVMNAQGIIGYIINAPINTKKDLNLGINIEKYGNVFLPVIKIGNENILHPALYYDESTMLNAYVGSDVVESKEKPKKITKSKSVNNVREKLSNVSQSS